MKKTISIILIMVILVFIAGLIYFLMIPKADPRSLFYVLMKRGIIRSDCMLLEKALVLDNKRDEWVKDKTVEHIKKRLTCIKNIKELSVAEQAYFGPPAKYGVDDLYIFKASTQINYGWVITVKNNKGVGIILFKG